MPRARKMVDAPLPGLEGEDQDPAPAATRTRAPRKAAGRTTVRKARPAGRVQTKAAMQNQVRAEVGMYLALLQGGWEMRDPECAAAATPERLDVIADRITAMISRSDSLLEMATKTGILGDIIALVSASLPIVSAVWRAHGPGGTGHQSPEEVSRGYAEQYPPYPAAVAH